MYQDLARAVLLEEDPAVAQAIVRIRSKHPRVSDGEVVGRLRERCAWRCAVVGAATGAGTALLDREVAALDLSYQALSLNRLAAGVALARRRPTNVGERGLAAAGSLLVAGASDVLRRLTVRAARRLLRDRAPSLFPVLSALAGGAIAYAAAKAFGRAADDLVAGRHRLGR